MFRNQRLIIAEKEGISKLYDMSKINRDISDNQTDWKFILHEFHRTSQFCPHLSIYRSGVYHFKKGGDHSFDGPGGYTRGIIGGCKELGGDRWQEQRDPRRNGKVAEESLSSFEYGAGTQRKNRLLERRRGQE